MIIDQKMEDFFRNVASSLKKDLEKNKKFYKKEKTNDWVIAYLKSEGLYDQYEKEIEQIYNLPLGIKCSEGKLSDPQLNAEDIQNCKALYSNLDITPFQAANPDFWITLNHLNKEGYSYIYKRFIHEKERQDTITTRMFGKGDHGLIYDSGISRLYFITHKLYDKTNKDPFHYLYIIFKSQTGFKDLVDTHNRYFYKRLTAILEAEVKFELELTKKELTLKGIITFDKLRRELIKVLNHDATIRSYDFLDKEIIKDFAYNTLWQIFEKKRVQKTETDIQKTMV